MEAGTTVLFVEDDPELRDAVAAELAEAGFEVLTAATGEDAMLLLRERAGAIHWLFTDLRLPGIVDGWRVADEFRFSYPLRPVIFATGAVREMPRDLNDSLFLRKPYRVRDVIRALAELSAGWHGCADEAEALSRAKAAPLASSLSWSPL